MEEKNLAIRRYIKLIFCGFLLIVFSGCNFLWNISNRVELERRIQEIAKENGLVITKSVCNMFEGSRVGYCQFSATQAEIDVFVKRLGLAVTKKGIDYIPNPDGTYPDNMPIEDAGALTVCSLENRFHCMQKCGLIDKQNLLVYGQADGSKEFRSSKGESLDFYVLYYDTVTHKTCIVAGFKYG